MAVYKPYKKTASGKEEVKIPYAVLADPPDLSKYVTTDGGTINKSKTIKMDASANSNGANLKWGTVNSKNPYIGYASDQTDGTFVVGSLLGTNYASGLAIGGGSGNLLWKGTKVATTSDIPAAVTESTVSGWGFTKNAGTITGIKMNGESKGTSGVVNLGTVLTNATTFAVLTIKQNGTVVGTFTARQSDDPVIDITFHLYEHNIYLSCSNTTSTVAPSRAYIYFTIITTDARTLNWTRLNNILRTAERNAGGYGYIGDPEGNNKSFNASVQKIQAFNTNSIYVTMVYNNSLLGIDNTYDGVTFYSNYVTITDTVRTIL